MTVEREELGGLSAFLFSSLEPHVNYPIRGRADIQDRNASGKCPLAKFDHSAVYHFSRNGDVVVSPTHAAHCSPNVISKITKESLMAFFYTELVQI